MSSNHASAGFFGSQAPTESNFHSRLTSTVKSSLWSAAGSALLGAAIIYGGPSFLSQGVHDLAGYANDNFLPSSVASVLTDLASSEWVPSRETACFGTRAFGAGTVFGIGSAAWAAAAAEVGRGV